MRLGKLDTKDFAKLSRIQRMCVWWSVFWIPYGVLIALGNLRLIFIIAAPVVFVMCLLSYRAIVEGFRPND